MYSLNKQIHPPTVVEHSVYCNFYSDNERNLIVGGSNQLKIYRLISSTKNEDVTSIENNDKQSASSDNNKIKLECIQSFSFFGEITSINFVRLNKNVRDSVIITFAEAKLSVVEYDPNTHNLRTLSMNYFEDDEFKQGYINNNVQQSIVRSDPDSRCCAMFNYGRNIIILPFKSETSSDEHVEQTIQIQSMHEIKQTARIGYVYFEKR